MNHQLLNIIARLDAGLLLLLAVIFTPVLAQDQHVSESGHGDAAEQPQHDRQRLVRLTADQRARLDLEVMSVEVGSTSAIVEAPAQVQFSADNVARVGPRLQSKVISVTRDLGDTVKAGDTVAIFDSVDLGRAKARYLTAKAHHNTAAAHYERDRKLAEKQIVSEAELLKTRAEFMEARAEKNAVMEELRLYGLDQKAIEAISTGSEQPLSRYPLTSPIDGVVQQRELVAGQTVSATDTPIHVVNNDPVWVMIDAYEQALPRLQPGQEMTLTLRALPEQTFRGATDWVSQQLDPESRTVTVRGVLANPDNALRAGMFGTARIHTDAKVQHPLVPVDAVQSLDGDNVVFVPGKESGAYRAVTVKLGDEGQGYVEIRQGLQVGDEVVIVGAFDLKSALTAEQRSADHSH